MCTLREMVNIIVSTKFNNKWVMLVILIIFDVNKSHVAIVFDCCVYGCHGDSNQPLVTEPKSK